MAAVLHESAPEMARQVTRPGRLLLTKNLRPRELMGPFVRLADSYIEYVAPGVAAGLQDLVGAGQAWQHNEKVLYAGAFSVRKDSLEDRVIMAAVPVNQLLNKLKMAMQRFAFIPAMRSLRTKPGKRLLKYKRDARHYFFQLSLACAGGGVWRCRQWAEELMRSTPGRCVLPWGSPLQQGGPRRSQRWQRNISPASKRVVYGAQAPRDWPVWGSIIDNFWSLAHEDEVGELIAEDAQPSSWMRSVEDERDRTGAEINTKKNIDAAEVRGHDHPP